MSAPAAISAQLVGLRSVSTHKSVVLSIHVPEELALRVVEVFGWPTLAAPVPVAIARLEEPVESQQPRSDVDEAPGSPHPSKGRHWSELTLAQQTGIIRNESLFWEFAGVGDSEGAADYIRTFCEVESCRALRPGTQAAARWAQLQVRYGSFLRQRNNAA